MPNLVVVQALRGAHWRLRLSLRFGRPTFRLSLYLEDTIFSGYDLSHVIKLAFFPRSETRFLCVSQQL